MDGLVWQGISHLWAPKFEDQPLKLVYKKTKAKKSLLVTVIVGTSHTIPVPLLVPMILNLCSLVWACWLQNHFLISLSWFYMFYFPELKPKTLHSSFNSILLYIYMHYDYAFRCNRTTRLKCCWWNTGCTWRVRAIFGLGGRLKNFFEGTMMKFAVYSVLTITWVKSQSIVYLIIVNIKTSPLALR